jgi:dUTP pyrophosphatase
MSDAARSRIKVEVRVLPHGRGLALPAYQSAGAAGMDLVAALPAKTPSVLLPLDRVLVPTGLVIALPDGYEAQVRPRSGLALRSGTTVLNSPGTIDCDFRGEVMVLLVNLGREPVTIRRGDRIAQIVVSQVVRARLVKARVLTATQRGGGGFGSTGAGRPAAKGRTRAMVRKSKR